MIVGSVEGTEVEVLVALSLDIFVKQRKAVGAVEAGPALMEWIAQALLSAADVPPWPVADRRGNVGLLHSRLHFIEDRLDEGDLWREVLLAVVVLSLQIFEQLWIVDVTHPRIRVVDCPGRAIPSVWSGRRHWRSS